jgi:hypothetical protein
MYGIKDGLDYCEELYRFSCQKGRIQIYITGKKIGQVRDKTNYKYGLKRVKYCTLIVMNITVSCELGFIVPGFKICFCHSWTRILKTD